MIVFKIIVYVSTAKIKYFGLYVRISIFKKVSDIVECKRNETKNFLMLREVDQYVMTALLNTLNVY